VNASRSLRLRPWLVRALIPAGYIGTYQLYSGGFVTYVGRSDTDLRRRLTQHADAKRAEFFIYDIHYTAEQAFTVECSLFHNTYRLTSNKIHPATPAGAALSCIFCRGVNNTKLHQI
jgi:hypothetical protein